MIAYAIRQISTGFYLPQKKRKRGFTNDEPVDCNIGKILPRLFSKIGPAKVALFYWLQGI
jgi:hypothetical protein